MGLAHLQELRDAVARFRTSGKPAIAYAETFGEFVTPRYVGDWDGDGIDDYAFSGSEGTSWILPGSD